MNKLKLLLEWAFDQFALPLWQALFPPADKEENR